MLLWHECRSWLWTNLFHPRLLKIINVVFYIESWMIERRQKSCVFQHPKRSGGALREQSFVGVWLFNNLISGPSFSLCISTSLESIVVFMDLSWRCSSPTCQSFIDIWMADISERWITPIFTDSPCFHFKMKMYWIIGLFVFSILRGQNDA